MYSFGELRPDERRAGLHLLLGGIDDPDRNETIEAGLETMLAAPHDHLLIGARSGERLSAVVWGTRSGDDSLLVGDPGLASGLVDADEAVAGIAKCLADAADRLGLVLVQVMLGPQRIDLAPCFLSAGWERATRLEYLAARVGPENDRLDRREVDSATSWRWVDADSLAPAALERLVAATHEDSQDCPFLEGRRSPAELLATYARSSESGTALWRVLLDDDEPAGCVLAGLQGGGTQIEWIYFGVARNRRGMGLGDRLAEHGFAQARSIGVGMIVLGLDESNEPARRLYARWGFRVWDRRLVLLRWRERPSSPLL